MKPMTLNMSKMKKVAGDKHSSTFKHDDGHMIQIAHAKLPAIQRKQLEKLPIHNYDEGGSVDTTTNAPSSDPDSAQESMRKAFHFDEGGLASTAKKFFDLTGASPTPTPAPEQTQDEKYEAIRQQNKKNIGYAKGGALKVKGEPEYGRDDRYKDGGDVERDVPVEASKLESQYAAEDAKARGEPVADTGQQWADEIGKEIPNVDPNATPAEANQPPQVSSDQPVPAASPVTQQLEQSAPMTSGTSDIGKAFNQGQRAISEQQAVDTHKAAANADVLQNDVQARQNLDSQFQKNLQDNQQHQQQFMQDYMNNHINPNHYQESLSSGQKVQNAIGLLLGIGGGPMGNQAAKYINEQIDRDIRAQESRLGQQKTLLEANHNLYGDIISGNAATRINMNDIMDHKIQLAAAKLGTPQAKAAADAQHAQFTMQNAALLQQNAIRQTVMQAATQNGGRGLDAIDLAHAGLIPPEEAQKEQASIDAQKASIQQTRDLFAKMDAEQTPSNLLNPQSHERMQQYKAQLVNAVVNASASKRLTPDMVKLEMEPLFTKNLENQKTRENALQTTLNIIKGHADPTPHMSKYAPGALPNYQVLNQDQQAAAWARSNPKDPRAAAIKQKLGIR